MPYHTILFMFYEIVAVAFLFYLFFHLINCQNNSIYARLGETKIFKKK